MRNLLLSSLLLTLVSCESPTIGSDLKTKFEKREVGHPITQTLTVDTATGPAPVGEGEIFPYLGEIINIGKALWPIVEAGKPVANIATDYATALPKDGEAVGFDPTTTLATMTLRADNGFGMEVVHIRLSALASTNGTYIAVASIIPSEVDVMWGYTVNIKVTSITITQRRNYSALVMVVESEISTPVKLSKRTYVIDIDAQNHAVIN